MVHYGLSRDRRFAAVPARPVRPRAADSTSCAAGRGHRHIVDMATYSLIQRPNSDGFDVEVIRQEGEPIETAIRFETQAAAERWIVTDARLSRMTNQGNFRMQWRP
jgi:hypothetical protein